MPRFGNNSTPANAINRTNSHNGQVKFHWSFSCEVDLPSNGLAAAGADSPARTRAGSDDLGALLDKALAFAG